MAQVLRMVYYILSVFTIPHTKIPMKIIIPFQEIIKAKFNFIIAGIWKRRGKNFVFLFSLSFEHNFYLVRERLSLPFYFLMLNVLRKSFKCISSCFSFVLPFFFFFFFSPYSSSSSPRLSSARMRL